VTDMDCMFYDAESFHQDLRKWNVSQVKYHNNMFLNALSFDSSNSPHFTT